MFDPSQKTLLADKGEIRVGGRYQVDSIQMPKPLENRMYHIRAQAYEYSKCTLIRYCILTHQIFFCSVADDDTRKLEELETLVWTPGHHLTDRQIDQFLVISR